LWLLAFASCARQSEQEFTNSNLHGTYKLVETIKPYVKFAGGPQIVTGYIYFDGNGQLWGQQKSWDESVTQRVRGTYQVKRDGTGSSQVAVAPNGANPLGSRFIFQIDGSNNLRFVSEGLQLNSDWISSNSLQANGQAAYSGTLVKQSNLNLVDN
jgi:hypothetical protein